MNGLTSISNMLGRIVSIEGNQGVLYKVSGVNAASSELEVVEFNSEDPQPLTVVSTSVKVLTPKELIISATNWL